MKGNRIAFRLATYDPARASELVKRLVCQATSSHGGTYAHRRKGLLDEIPYVWLSRGVVIVRTEDTGRVAALPGQMAAEVHARKIETMREDLQVLLKPSSSSDVITITDARLLYQ